MPVIANVRARVKDLADIKTADTSFDADIDNYINDAVNLLWPIAQAELDPDETAVFAANTKVVTLPSGIKGVRRLELKDGSYFYGSDDFWVHNGKLYLDSEVESATTARIFGLGYYTLATLPAELEPVIHFWALSLLYSSFAGNRRKYNSYLATSGAAADRDMKDSAQEAMDTGNQLLMDRATLRGQ